MTSLTPHMAAECALDRLLEPLAGLLADPAVCEVMVNAPDQIWGERQGVLARHDIVLPEGTLRASIRLLATLAGASTLETEASLEGAWRNWRVTAVLPPVVRNHPCLCLRRHQPRPLPLAAWRGAHVRRRHADELPQGWNPCLHKAISDRHNILVSGSTGSGKTTLLGGLLERVGSDERVVCLEDTPELPLACAHQLRLLARSGHSLRSLLRLALRLRPDRLVVGEVRGPEAFDLLQAMATGHAGCLGTIHAPDTRGALARLEQLILTAGLDWPLAAVRAQIAQWIGLLVHVSRDPGGRCVSQIQRLRGFRRGEFQLTEVGLD